VRLRLGQGLQLGQLGAIDALEQEPREFAAGCKHILADTVVGPAGCGKSTLPASLPASG
jgi:ABC-type cobalamin transport system ATPase subunit